MTVAIDEALLYDWYNAHVLRRQNLDVGFYSQLARERSARNVLELGCGTGRVSIPLAAAGLSVTGLDRSGAMLRRAAEKARGAGVVDGIRWVNSDMAAFGLGRRFDLILVPYSAFQLLAPDQRPACLAAAAKHLCPTGRLIIDVSPAFSAKPEAVSGHVFTEACPELGAVIAHYSSLQQRPQLGTTRFIDEYDVFFASSERARHELHETYYSLPRHAWLDVFSAGGFKLVALHESYERSTDCVPYKLIFELVVR